MVAGREASPQDVKNTQRLKDYWRTGPGSVRIAWSAPGAYTRCIAELGKYVHGDTLHGLCANLFHDVNGEWPGAHSHDNQH